VHDTFRQNNIALSRERDTLKEIHKALEEAGITVEDAVRLKGIETDLNEQKLFKKGEIDKIVQERLKDATTKHEKALNSERERIKKLTGELEVMRIDEAAVAVALKNGLEETAVDDIKARARQTFKLVDGKPKALNSDGYEIADDAGNPLTFDQWVQNLKPNYPHLFKRNQGGGGTPQGAGGGGGRPISTTKNPWNKGPDFNLTEQGRIYRSDPAKAERMKAAATG
jgi:hypothetical protein